MTATPTWHCSGSSFLHSLKAWLHKYTKLSWDWCRRLTPSSHHILLLALKACSQPSPQGEEAGDGILSHTGSIWWSYIEPLHLQLWKGENVSKGPHGWGEEIQTEDSTNIQSLKGLSFSFLFLGGGRGESICGNVWSCPLPAVALSPAGHEQWSRSMKMLKTRAGMY